MALSANLQIEVRTTGSNSNGGGFVSGASGTDWSQQDAAKYSGTDLASVSSLVVSSASHNFISTDVGNLIQISGGTGFSAGFYQIVSVSANQATLDRSPGTVGVTGTWAVGGGLLTIVQALTFVVQGNTVWLKSGTYTLTTTITPPAIYNYKIQGYQTVHGDFTGTRPLITTATNSTNLFTYGFSNADHQYINLSLSNTAASRAAGIIASSGGESNSVTCYNCLFDGFTTSVKGNFSGDYYFAMVHMVGCEVKNCTGTGAVWNDGQVMLNGCFIHGNTGAGLYFDQSKTPDGPFIVLNTIFSGNQDGILWAPSSVNNMLIVQNSAFYNQSRDCIRMTPNVAMQLVLINTIADTNTGWFVNVTGSPTYVMFIGKNNAPHNNTAGNYNGVTGDASDLTISVSPWTAAGTDFSLNTTAGGGAVLKSAGLFGSFGAGTGYMSVGALVPNPSGGGGGGGLLVNPGMGGGING